MKPTKKRQRSSFESRPLTPDGSTFSFLDVRRAIDEPQDNIKDDEQRLMLEFEPPRNSNSGLVLGREECQHKDESSSTTPSLMNAEEEDDDDENALENLSECIGSLTSDETNAMIKAFDLYVQQKHQHDTTNTNSNTHCPDDGLVFTDSNSKNDHSHLLYNGGSTQTTTPEAPWSLKKWLLCRSTSASMDGIHVNNGFEPDTYTLDGIRKELFGEFEWNGSMV